MWSKEPPAWRKDGRIISSVAPDATILARYVSGDQGAAVVLREFGRGRCVYWAGPPALRAAAPWSGTAGFGDSPSFAPVLWANTVVWAADGPAPVWVEGLPAVSDYARCRPYDSRIVPTHEFFPLVGERGYLLVLASYWAEPAELKLWVQLPADVVAEDCQVEELVKGSHVHWTQNGQFLTIPAQLTTEDALLAYCVRFRG